MYHNNNKKKENVQPLHEYIKIIIRDHLDDFTHNGQIETKKIIERTYMYARKIGYTQNRNEIINIIHRIIHNMRECCRTGGEKFCDADIKKVREHLIDIRKTERMKRMKKE